MSHRNSRPRAVGDTWAPRPANLGRIECQAPSDGTKLGWAYDAYQRPSCFADAMATNAGHGCPASPTAADFTPGAGTMLIVQQYYADSSTTQTATATVAESSSAAAAACRTAAAAIS